MDDIRAHFGRVLRRRRQERGLSQEELAFRAERSAVYISQLERGLYNPTISVLFALGRALEVHPAELLKDIPADAPDAGDDREGARPPRRTGPGT